MKANLILLSVSSVLGIFLGLLLGRSIVESYYGLGTGVHFESLDDLRSSMLERDERDLKNLESVSLRSILSPHPSDSIIYELQPNLDVLFQKVRVQTNSCGMRGPERQVFRSPGVFRVALLGDSFAFGWGVEQDQIFAKVLQDHLNQIAGDKFEFEVLNFGVPGYSTFQEVAQFLETGIDFDPDLVLAYFVDNDFHLPFYIENFEAPGKLTPAKSIQRWRHQKASEEQRKRASQLVNRIDPNHNFSLLAEELEKRGVPLYVTINPRRHSHYDLERLHVLRNDPRVNYLPLREPFVFEVYSRDLPLKSLSLAGDPHPSALRHDILGKLLARGLVEEIL